MYYISTIVSGIISVAGALIILVLMVPVAIYLAPMGYAISRFLL